ncbi:MAG: TonB-dependent receptor [Magnetococcales bacterium]|nr:TonB-dependent receptor [Magnetococcales bacterium]
MQPKFGVLLILFLLGTSSVGLAAEAPHRARLIDLDGTVEFNPEDATTWREAKVGQELRTGDHIRTGPLSRVSLLMADESLIKLKESTDLVIGEVAPSSVWSLEEAKAEQPPSIRSEFRLQKGGAWFLNKNREVAIQFKTPAAEIGVRGTELVVQLDGHDAMQVTALEGSAQIQNPHGELVITSGEEAVTRSGSAPVKQKMLTTENAVQWFIAVPALLATRNLQQKNQTAAQQASLQEVWRDFQSGALVRASQTLAAFTAQYPQDAVGWQLRALTALALDRREEMESAARQATTTGADAANSWIIHAYVQQALFQLDEAERSIRRALAIEADNITARVALARLQFGGGRTQEALTTLDQAAPEVMNTHAEGNNLRGFMLLALRQEAGARQHFQHAIRIDSTLAEPHLGLGLIHMRQGETARAFEEITTAVLLDPTRSLMRSYWAKMLYQVERHQKALDVLQMARMLDPRDPTPHLYEAMILRDLNLPTQAIQAINQAMARNDHRGVYRSRFMLDGDLAVKNVDLSKLYNQLELDAWARGKAIASTRQDYTNSAAHLFYAGSLTDEEGRSWARNTETLLARLLQPANLNTFNSFNQYTSFVEKPGLRFDLSATVGNHKTLNHYAVVSGAVPQQDLAFQAGHFTSNTDGWRSGQADHTRSLVGYLKWDGIQDGSVLVAASCTGLEQSGVGERRHEIDAPPAPRDALTSRSYRLEGGYHHHFGPGSDLLLHAARIRTPLEIQNVSGLDWADVDGVNHLYDWLHGIGQISDYHQVQGEYLYKYGAHQWLAGAIHYAGTMAYNHDTWLELYGPVEFGTYPWSTLMADQKRTLETLFVQDIFQITPSWILESAIHFDYMRTGNLESQTTWSQSQWSPRLGLIWSPEKEHTVRLAALRSLLPFYSDRLDPADIAGVPIHRNGAAGSVTDEAQRVWEYATDQGIWSTGLFRAHRELPEIHATGNRLIWESEIQGLELQHNRLLEWAPGLGLTARYRLQQIEDPRAELANTVNRDEHLAVLGLKWVDASGWSAKAKESWRCTDFAAQRASEQIWITDLELNYEFPKKWGVWQLKVNNLFDQRFNWVTDPFVLQGRNPAREILMTIDMTF